MIYVAHDNFQKKRAKRTTLNENKNVELKKYGS